MKWGKHQKKTAFPPDFSLIQTRKMEIAKVKKEGKGGRLEEARGKGGRERERERLDEIRGWQGLGLRITSRDWDWNWETGKILWLFWEWN